MNNLEIEQFNNYYFNKLSEDAKWDFERLLAEDDEVTKQYTDFVDVMHSLEYANNERIREKTARIINKQSRSVTLVRLMGYAASFLLICTVSYLYYSSTQDLYQEYFSIYSETNSHLGEGDGQSEIEDCINDYTQHDFTKAIVCLEAMDSENAESLFYLAMCYANVDDTKKAIATLLEVEGGNGSKMEESNWYLALLYLNLDNEKEAIIRLERIVNNQESNYKKKAAESLLSQITK